MTREKLTNDWDKFEATIIREYRRKHGKSIGELFAMMCQTEAEGRFYTCASCGNTTEWTLLKDFVTALPPDFGKRALKITELVVCKNCGYAKASDHSMIKINDDLSEDTGE
jgi:hypothetical protein